MINEYIDESQRLTVSSLEGLFGTEEFQANIHQSLSNLFSTLNKIDVSVDDVSKSIVELFHHLIISIYRKFMINNEEILLDDKFQKCLLNKAFEREALPKQRELLYILTSGSSLIQIFHKMLIYMDADIQRLKTTATIESNQCIQRYARETLCPICITTSSSYNKINNHDDVNEVLCETDCRYIIKTCFNQANDPYAAFAAIAKNYSSVIKEIEQDIVELKVSLLSTGTYNYLLCVFKLVERLAKVHIYLYDMVVNTTNSRRMYTELQTACPNSNVKPFSPIRSLPPIHNERRQLVSQWNISLHYLLKRIQSAVDHLNTKLTHKLMQGICSKSNYASKSDQCTQIDKQTPL